VKRKQIDEEAVRRRAADVVRMFDPLRDSALT
jgi:hypothetical protein